MSRMPPEEQREFKEAWDRAVTKTRQEMVAILLPKPKPEKITARLWSFLTKRRRKKNTPRQECQDLLDMAWGHVEQIHQLAGEGRWKPRQFYDSIDGLIGCLAQVQLTLEARSRIRPHHQRKKEEKDLRYDLWWPRYHKRCKELEAKGIDPNSAEAAPHLEDLASAVFD